jgi:hypothetical protein
MGDRTGGKARGFTIQKESPEGDCGQTRHVSTVDQYIPAIIQDVWLLAQEAPKCHPCRSSSQAFAKMEV